MLPAILGAAALAGGFTAYRFVRKCSVCDKRMSWTYSCLCCSKSVCGACSTEKASESYRGDKISNGGHVCGRVCLNKINEGIQDSIKKADEVAAFNTRVANVKLYSENYKGKQNIKFNKKISSDFFETKEEARDQLKKLSATNYSDNVWQVREDFKTNTNGNYHYREWMVTGVI